MSLLSSLLGGSSKSKQKKTPVGERIKVPKTAQQTIPYTMCYQHGIIETTPGTFTKMYPLADVNFSIASALEQDHIFRAYGSLLNMFTSDVDLQITTMNRAIDKDRFLQNVLLPYNSEDGWDEYRREVNQGLQNRFAESSNNMLHEKYLTVAIKADSIEAAVSRFGRIDAEVANEVKRITSQSCAPMSTVDRLSMLYDIYNPGAPLPLSSIRKMNGKNVETFSLEAVAASGLTTKDAIAPECIVFKKSHFELGEKYGRVLYLGTLPSILNSEMFVELSDVPCKMITSAHFNVLEQSRAIKLIRRQTVNINSNVVDAQKKAAKSGYSPDMISPSLRASQEEAEKLQQDITSRNQRLFFVTVTACVFADTLEELDKFTEMVQTIAQKHVCIMRTAAYQQENGFNSTLPLAQNQLAIKRLLTTESASLFIPFSVQEVAQLHGLFYGCNAVSGNPIFFSRTAANNPNGCILGTSGSGKSFAAKQELVNFLLGTDYDIYVIDPEREYTNLAREFGGEVINISASASEYLNPLDMDLNYSDEDGSPLTLKADFVISLLETIMKAQYGLSPQQSSIIDRCVRELYIDYLEKMRPLRERGITIDTSLSPTLADLRKKLRSQAEPEVYPLVTALELYTEGSLNLFSHKTNVNIKNRFVVYDIRDIGDNLKDLGLQVCLNDIWNRTIANGMKGKRTCIYFDEMHLLTQRDGSANFLRQIYKRARKHGGIPTGMTQNVEDLLRSEAARGILNNCDMVMMLNQTPLDKNQLVDIFSLSATQAEFMSNGTPGTGILYIGGKSAIPFVNRADTSTKLYSVMSTKLEDRAATATNAESKQEPVAAKPTIDELLA